MQTPVRTRVTSRDVEGMGRCISQSSQGAQRVPLALGQFFKISELWGVFRLHFSLAECVPELLSNRSQVFVLVQTQG